MKKILNLISEKLWDMSLYKRTAIVFVLIALVPISLAYKLSVSFIEKITMNQAVSDSMQSVQAEAKSINGIFQSISMASEYIQNDLGVKECLISLSSGRRDPEQLAGMNKKIEIINAILGRNINSEKRCYLTILNNGHVLYSNWNMNSSDSDSIIKSYERNYSSPDNGKVVWGGVEKNYVSSDNQTYPDVLSFYATISDKERKSQIGTILLSIPQKNLSEAMELLYKNASTNKKILKSDEPEKRFLLYQDNNILASTLGDDYINSNIKDLYKIEIPTYDYVSGSVLTRDIGNSKCLLLYKWIGSFGCRLVKVIPYTNIANKSGFINNNLLLIYVICVTIFLTMTVFIARYLTKPIKSLANSMLDPAVISGAPELPLQKATKKNEVAILGESFKIMRNNILHLIDENREKELRKRDAELKALQAQISPHFLFNTLNSVRWAAINNNPAKAADMVLALENLLRMTLGQTDEFITLEQEIENIGNYLAIIKMRHTFNFDVTYAIHEDVKHYKIPKLLLQPLVENSIIHGFQYATSNGKIEISACKDTGNLLVRIKDNGIGVDKLPQPENGHTNGMKFTGIGLKNVEERIKLHFGNEYGIIVESNSDQGTNVVLKLPL